LDGRIGKKAAVGGVVGEQTSKYRLHIRFERAKGFQLETKELRRFFRVVQRIVKFVGAQFLVFEKLVKAFLRKEKCREIQGIDQRNGLDLLARKLQVVLEHIVAADVVSPFHIPSKGRAVCGVKACSVRRAGAEVENFPVIGRNFAVKENNARTGHFARTIPAGLCARRKENKPFRLYEAGVLGRRLIPI
ncbi:MAG: hypothetical protein ACI4SV_04475, partial [Duodenibacillus sp.]